MATNKVSALRHMLYDQKGGYLLLPVAIMLVLCIVAIVLPMLEEEIPAFATWAHHTRWLVPNDPGMAQLLLGAIAGSCITILSVVYSVLLIALTFASIQFSPRILTSFLKDRVSQTTLGMFIGTFAYCIILLPNVHTGTRVRVPTLSLTFALVLATLCLFYLIYFIQHIAQAIQANYIVDRIGRETEIVLRTMFGDKLKGFPPVDEEMDSEPQGIDIISERSGYVQFIDEPKLLNLAISANANITILRGVGQFIPAHVPCMNVAPPVTMSDKFRRDCLSCVHVGPVRSMEMDVECGILQMVDIALKAISPAVNDPSTAISCIDHLSSVLVLAATLEPPTCRVYDEKAVVRLMRRQPTFPRLLNIAFDQVSPYGKGDMAVSLRLMRALQDIAGTTKYPPYLNAILVQAQRVTKACAACFEPEDCAELFERFTKIEARVREVS